MRDFDILKKKFGENFAKFCRSNFSTIMEQEGLLAKIILQKFQPNRELYDDLVQNNLTDDFVGFIYNQAKITTDTSTPTSKSPKELFEMAGYNLYECKTQDDVDKFIKYYEPKEVICTFNDPDRIRFNRIFFAVKKDVDNIQRKDFKNPDRQDLYGTSVISLQFTKGEYSHLSIKNRYNHSVRNPDATFGNNLENIQPGLTQSFDEHYNIKLRNRQVESLNIPHYIKSSDGKYYKYLIEINDNYFCADNIVVSSTAVAINNDTYFEELIANQYDKDRYELIENILLDKKEKTLLNLGALHNGFVDSVGKIEKIEVLNIPNNQRLLTITNDKQEKTILTLNNKNCIVKYENNDIKEIQDDFLYYNMYLQEFKADKLESVGNNFNRKNKVLEVLDAPNLNIVGNYFLCANRKINSLELLELDTVGDYFCSNAMIKNLSLPKLQYAGDYFCFEEVSLQKIYTPQLLMLGENALTRAISLTEVDFTKLLIVGDQFLLNNRILKNFYAPALTRIGNNCMTYNKDLQIFNCSQLKEIGYGFLENNESLEVWKTPELVKVGRNCLRYNSNNIDFYAPKLTTCLVNSFDKNPKIKSQIYVQDKIF